MYVKVSIIFDLKIDKKTYILKQIKLYIDLIS